MAGDPPFMLRKVYALIGVSFGIAAAVCFSPVNQKNLHNWKASVMGAISGFVALINFWQHHRRHQAYKKQRLVAPHRTEIRIVALLFTMICLAGFIAFLVIGLFNKEKLDGRSIYIPAVWSFLGMKWGITLLHYVNIYDAADKELAKKYPPLLKDPLLAADVTPKGESVA